MFVARPCARFSFLIFAYVVAASTLEASSIRVPRHRLVDESSLLQVKLDVEGADAEADADRGPDPECKRSLLEDQCSGFRYRSAIQAYKAELDRHGDVLKALKRLNPQAFDVAEATPRIAALLEELSTSRARLVDTLELDIVPDSVSLEVDAKAAIKPTVLPAVPQMQLYAKSPFVFTWKDGGLNGLNTGGGTQGGGGADGLVMGGEAQGDAVAGDFERVDGSNETMMLPAVHHHHHKRGGRFWIVLVFIGLVLVLLACMMVVVGVLNIEEKKKVKDEDKPSPTQSASRRSKFIQVALPYWLPTDSQSSGLLWIGLFFVVVAFSTSLMYWVCRVVLLISHILWPALVVEKHTRWCHSAGLRAASFAALALYPAVFLSLKKKLEGRWEQWWLLTVRIFVMLVVNMWNVGATYIQRGLQDALMFKDIDAFWVSTRLMFAGSAISSVLHMFGMYLTGILTIRWRNHLTREMLDLYMSQRRYYRLESTEKVGVDNPDQRIQEDCLEVAAGCLNLGLGLFHSVITLLSFALVLWNLTPMLTFSCMGYAVVGTIVTLILTWQMVKLTYFSQSAEADFRYSLVHIRTNSEAIAFYRGEEREKGISLNRFSLAIDLIYRRLNWEVAAHGFTMYYETAASIVPATITSRLYFWGDLDFGAYGQAFQAFMTTLNSLSFIVSQRAVVCGLATSVNRLGVLQAALQRPIEKAEAEKVKYFQAYTPSMNIKDLTAVVPNTSQTIIRSLSLTANRGDTGHEANVRILLSGRSGAGKSSLLRILAGLWTSGKGEVVRPPDEECMFLPQRPYMPQGNLRTQLTYPQDGSAKAGARTSDEELRVMLGRVGLETLPDRFEGGFDAVCDWARVLSLGEQQRVASVRCFLRMPKLAVLDEATSALSSADETRFYDHFQNLNLSYISVGHRDSLLSYHNHVLVLEGDGEWKFVSTDEYRRIAKNDQKKCCPETGSD